MPGEKGEEPAFKNRLINSGTHFDRKKLPFPMIKIRWGIIATSVVK